MPVGFFDLALWSFLMATAAADGDAGAAGAAGGGGARDWRVRTAPMTPSSRRSAARSGQDRPAVAVHTVAMLIAAGAIAWVIFAWVGLAVLRRAWINLDLVWSVVLIATGAIFLVLASIDLASYVHGRRSSFAGLTRVVRAAMRWAHERPWDTTIEKFTTLEASGARACGWIDARHRT